MQLSNSPQENQTTIQTCTLKQTYPVSSIISSFAATLQAIEDFEQLREEENKRRDGERDADQQRRGGKSTTPTSPSSQTRSYHGDPRIMNEKPYESDTQYEEYER